MQKTSWPLLTLASPRQTSGGPWASQRTLRAICGQLMTVLKGSADALALRLGKEGDLKTLMCLLTHRH